MSQINKRVGRSPGTRIAAESLLMLAQRYREKVSAFRLWGSLELPGITNFSTSFVNNTPAVQWASEKPLKKEQAFQDPVWSVARAWIKKPSQENNLSLMLPDLTDA